MHCLCTEPVGHLHLVLHQPTQITVAVGSSCVQSFAGEAAYKDALQAKSNTAATLREAAKGTQSIASFLSPSPPPRPPQDEKLRVGKRAVIDATAVRGLTNHRPKSSQPAQADFYKVQWKDRRKGLELVESSRIDEALKKVYTDSRWKRIGGGRRTA